MFIENLPQMTTKYDVFPAFRKVEKIIYKPLKADPKYS